ncbi:MAG: YgfZ/GcvT domain-containing protein [Acidimicrobiales bacterium]
MPDLAADYATLREGVGALWLPRDFLVVAGPDAQKFLQGQLSQDVDMPVGASADSLLLSPQGKVVALLRVTRTGEAEFVLDTDGGWAQATIERLQRFKLRVTCTIETRDWRCLAVRGPGAHAAATGSAGALALPADWPGLPGVDLVGDCPEVPAGVPLCSPEAYEVARIEAGVAVLGRELDERTIPAEAGVVERSVSFTKGCYTGQELVARIDSRGGKVPRRLRGLSVAADGLPAVAGAAIAVGGKEVGVVTSVGHPFPGRPQVALGYVQRAVEPPADAELSWPGGSVRARVEALPLVP